MICSADIQIFSFTVVNVNTLANSLIPDLLLKRFDKAITNNMLLGLLNVHDLLTA